MLIKPASIVICSIGLMASTVFFIQPDLMAQEKTVNTIRTTSSSSSSTTTSSSSNSSSSGTHTLNGQTVHYKFQGQRQANSQIRTENDVFKLIAQVDQHHHTITVHPDKIIHNGISAPIDRFRQIDIVIEYETVMISVDGRRVLGTE